MTAEARRERTARLLALRLEEAACALERAATPGSAVARLLESASVATRHAVTLELVSSEQATAIWERASARHPALAQARLRRPPTRDGVPVGPLNAD